MQIPSKYTIGAKRSSQNAAVNATYMNSDIQCPAYYLIPPTEVFLVAVRNWCCYHSWMPDVDGIHLGIHAYMYLVLSQLPPSSSPQAITFVEQLLFPLLRMLRRTLISVSI